MVPSPRQAANDWRICALTCTLPLGTLAANLLGSLLLGLSVTWLGRHPGLPTELRLFVITGFLGGLTTFSTFSAEAPTSAIGRFQTRTDP